MSIDEIIYKTGLTNILIIMVLVSTANWIMSEMLRERDRKKYENLLSHFEDD